MSKWTEGREKELMEMARKYAPNGKCDSHDGKLSGPHPKCDICNGLSLLKQHKKSSWTKTAGTETP